MGGKLSISLSGSSCSDLTHITGAVDSTSVFDGNSVTNFPCQNSLSSEETPRSNRRLRAPMRVSELSSSCEDRRSTSHLLDVSKTPYCYSNPNLSSSLWSGDYEEEDGEDRELRTPKRSSSPPPPLPPRLIRKEPAESYRPTLSLTETKRSDPRIYPICQNGVKMSDTHYWLIPPPRRHGSVRLQRNPNELYVNVDDDDSESTPQAKTGGQFRRGNSERFCTSRWKMQRDLIARLQQVVPMATDQEVSVVLIGASWNFDEAMHRLKEELLCRTGYASMHRSQSLLGKHNYDLEAATLQAEQEYGRQQAFRES